MRLQHLSPAFVGAGGPGVFDINHQSVPPRTGVGLSFVCPKCRHESYVAFDNPLDGGIPHVSPQQATWHRTGETFETLILSPSIMHSSPNCMWHGFIGGPAGDQPGEVVTI